MSISRYNNNESFVPPPARIIVPAITDILHPFKMGERIDNLAGKYYNDSELGWVIMYANPQYDNEFEVPIGTNIRIPFPLQRVMDSWMINGQI